MKNLVLAVLIAVPSLSIAQESITVVGFNVESGGADPLVVAELVAEMNEVDIWGFSEVQNAEWADAFEEAAESAADYVQVLGTTGGGDKLLIVYDAERFEKIEDFELHDMREEHGRSPLVVKLRIRSTGTEFLFMVNHLYRGSSTKRHNQSRLLNTWARTALLPVVAVGDYNYDWHADHGDAQHDDGYDLLTKDDVFVWVRPDELIKSQCSTRYNSVLDFVFVVGDAQAWDVQRSRIQESQLSYCPDDDDTSDHRPLLATLIVP